MNITISWTPITGVTSQTVQYKLAAVSEWTTFGYVPLGSTSVKLTGLIDNKIYDFRVLTSCPEGADTPSVFTSNIGITCPTLTLTTSGSSISYSFSSLGGDVTGYTIRLYDNAGTTLLQTQQPVFTNLSTITGGFTGLTASTSYKIEAYIVAGIYNKTCTKVTATTTSGSACDSPTNIIGNLS